MTKSDLFGGGLQHLPPTSDGSYPVRSGNFVRPLVDGVPTFRRIAEAIGAARSSIWLCIAFYAPDFRFPDAGDTLFDALEHATARGIDVRVLFWRPNLASSGHGRTFPGTQADHDLLLSRRSLFSARWDRGHAAYCQHQKMWLIDAGQPAEIAFVGGINLTAKALGSPGHRDGGRHDLYVEVMGPSATDVHHNFVQRWNEASERDQVDGVWGPNGAASLQFPARVSEPRGASLVQIQRMVHPGRYADGQATPGGRQYDIAAGERSILDQYERAIDAARSSIYIENQALPVPRIARKLEDALQRGVEVVVLLPAEPEPWVRAARRDPARSELFAFIEALSLYETFALVGLSAQHGDERTAIYVHAKAMLIDDSWITIGSCNLHSNSLNGHTEMNASVWDGEVARALRCELLAEHLDQDTSMMSDRAAFRFYRQIAEHNRLAMTCRRVEWQGLVFAIDPTMYGK